MLTQSVCPPRSASKRSALIYIYTVELVYKGHPRDWTKFAVIHSDRYIQVIVLIPESYPRSALNIKFLENSSYRQVMAVIHSLGSIGDYKRVAAGRVEQVTAYTGSILWNFGRDCSLVTAIDR